MFCKVCCGCPNQQLIYWSIFFVPFSVGDIAGTCGDPGIPSHSSREQTDFRIRSKVFFACTEGYELIGSSERMCFPNGTWSGTQPFCKRMTMLLTDPSLCPPSIHSLLSPGRVIAMEVTFFFFHPCYFLSAAVQCGNPGTPSNGKVFRLDGTMFFHSVIYSCVDGYLLTGTTTRQCQANGTWSGVQPNCTSKLPAGTWLYLKIHV